MHVKDAGWFRDHRWKGSRDRESRRYSLDESQDIDCYTEASCSGKTCFANPTWRLKRPVGGATRGPDCAVWYASSNFPIRQPALIPFVVVQTTSSSRLFYNFFGVPMPWSGPEPGSSRFLFLFIILHATKSHGLAVTRELIQTRAKTPHRCLYALHLAIIGRLVRPPDELPTPYRYQTDGCNGCNPPQPTPADYIF